MDYILDILDEIALEGLDGITLDALWLRLKERPDFIFGERLDDETKEFIWNLVRRLRDVEFFRLPKPRSPLSLNNRYVVENELGIVTEANPLPEDIYPHEVVHDVTNNIIGSCSTYKTRINVSDIVRKVGLNLAYSYFGSSLVIVASQEARRNSLIGIHANPNLDLGGPQYCMLERIGRSRYRGEPTQGKSGLQALREDTKTIFYYRKILLKHNLVTKQVFQLKLMGNNVSGLLLHLTRFYKLIKPKFISFTEASVKFLKEKPNGMVDYKILRDHLSVPGILRRLAKIADFQKFVRTDGKVPYRTLYPDADIKQWKQKATEKEKTVRIAQLHDPNIDIRDVQRKLLGPIEDEEEEDEKSEGILYEKTRYIDVPLLTQCCMAIKNSGRSGVTQSQIGQSLGLTKVQSRTICKNAVKIGAVGCFMADVGRQRVSKFYLKHHDTVNATMDAFIEERVSEFVVNSEDFKTVFLNNKQISLDNNDDNIILETCINGDENRVSTRVLNNEFMLKSEANPKASCSGTPEINNSTHLGSHGVGNNNEILCLNDSSFSNCSSGLEPIHDDSINDNFNMSNSVNMEIDNDNFSNSVSETTNDMNVTISDSNIDKTSSSSKRAGEKLDIPVNNKKQRLESDDVNESVTELSQPNETNVSSNPELNNLIEQNAGGSNQEDSSIVKNVTNSEETCNGNLENFGDKVLSKKKKGNTSADKIVIDVDVTDDFHWLLTEEQCKKEIIRLNQNNQIACKSLKTYRLLKRSNLIIEAVHENKVINDIRKLVLMINEAEYREGQACRMDKKSLLRILFRLALDKHIKIYRVTLKSGENTKYLDFICDSKTTSDHPVIKSSIEFAKLKFQSSLANHGAVIDRNNVGNVGPTKRYVDVETRKMAIFYPKFNRMKVIHRFLFYLVYNYEGDESQDQDVARINLKKECDLTEDVTNLMSFVYYPKADWRMFVPPLPKYAKEGETNGWSLLSDVLVRLPLSLFTQLVHIPYYCPEIDLFLDHPIKRHLLVTKLPEKIRNCLTNGRKYIFTIHEALSRLAFIGLLQFGAQQNKEKEQIFTFVNRNATLLDTTMSSPGYNKISTDLEYPVQRYRFHTLLDVDGYWISAMNICMNTRLGGRCYVLGTDIVLENVQDKQEMIEAVKQRDFLEAPLLDNGYTPGDKLGAAGFDSALYSHLKRNWLSKPFKGLPEKRPVEIITPSSRKVLDSSNETKDSDKQTRVKQQQRLCNNFTKRKRAVSSSSSSSLPRKISIIKRNRVKPGKQSVKIRHIKPKKSLIRRPYYDQVDREALKQMSKLRVDWSEEEDRVLLICKIASAFICPDTRKQINANMFLAFREVLHKTLQASKNKTSRACQRRVAYMLRSANTCHNVNLCIEELRQDKEIVEKYGGTVEFIQKEADSKGKKIKEMENLWKKRFKELVSHLMSRYNYNFNNLSFNMRNQFNENFILPDNLKEFHQRYNLLSLDKTQFKSKGRFKSITNLTDIYSATLNVTIHSTLCCNSDKTSWSYHLFSIYQQYPEKLLRNVLNKLRSNQMVSFKKYYKTSRSQSNTYLPLTASPYQLSISYINLMQTKYQSELYLDCFKFFSNAMEKIKTNDFANDNGYQVLSLTGGSTAAIIQLYCDNIIEFNIDIPDQIIVLDPDVKNKDETYARLVQCYKDMLSNYKRDATSSVLFQKHNYACTAADESIISVKGPTEQGVNDQQNSSNEATALVAKAASRIALYLMRDDAVNATGMIPKEMDHAHDFFVVNSCNIYVKLKSTKTKESDLLNVDVKEINAVLENVRNSATFNDASVSDDESDLNNLLKENFPDDKIDLAISILNKIREKTSHGLTNAELISNFGNSFEVVDIVNKLVKLNLALHTGVVLTRYVYYTNVRAWLVYSYRNVRFEKDARVPLNKSQTISFSNISDLDIDDSCLDDVDDDSDTAKISNSGVLSVRTDLYQPQPSTSKKINATDGDNLSQNKTTGKSSSEKSNNFVNRWGLQDEDYKKLIRHNMSHPIKVIMRPWIRVDATLNRRVFDTILTSVLSHIMLNPGISLLMLQNRFSPAYVPHHITEVCDALIKIKCIKRYHVFTTSKPTLTSKPCKVSINENPTGLEPENEICYEPMKFAILNLGKFINTNVKPYSIDFIKCLLGR